MATPLGKILKLGGIGKGKQKLQELANKPMLRGSYSRACVVRSSQPIPPGKSKGSYLKGQWHRTFEGRYDNLLNLLEVEVQSATLSALTQYYDLPLGCFTFRDFQLAPTLEEYERLLRLPMAKSPPYLFKGHYRSWALVAKLLKILELEVLRRKRNRNDLEGFPKQEEDGLANRGSPLELDQANVKNRVDQMLRRRLGKINLLVP
ncbi:hypothetical protein CR513_43965, partial [Mucuna pruriens]